MKSSFIHTLIIIFSTIFILSSCKHHAKRVEKGKGLAGIEQWRKEVKGPSLTRLMPTDDIEEYYFQKADLPLKAGDQIFLYKGYDKTAKEVIFIVALESNAGGTATYKYYSGRVLCPSVCGLGNGNFYAGQKDEAKRHPLQLIAKTRDEISNEFIIPQDKKTANIIPIDEVVVNEFLSTAAAVYLDIRYRPISRDALFLYIDSIGDGNCINSDDYYCADSHSICYGDKCRLLP